MKDNAPLVTVIIPTHNSASTLEQCLQSVRAQTYPNIEVLVVDNHSLDNTIEIAAQFAEVILAGPERSAQINVGARKAHGFYLYRIDGDMLLESGVVQACVEAIQKDGYDAIEVPNRSRGESFWGRVRTMERDTYLDDPLIVAARFWKRTAFAAVGGMDESLVACEDYDLHNRLVAAGYRIGRVSATEFHLGESDSLWDYAAQSFYYGPSVFRYLRKHPNRGVRQMIPLRSSYLRHWKSLARQPHLTLGLLLLKLVQYLAAALGIAADGLGLVTERGRVAHQAMAGFLLVLFSIWALVSSLPGLGIQLGAAGSWAILFAGLLAWQGVSRLRDQHQAESRSATLMRVSLAFSPLLLLPVLRPMLGDNQALETWRMASSLAAAVSMSWLLFLSRSSPKSTNHRELSKAWSGHLPLIIILVASAIFTVVFSLSGLKLLSNFSLRSSDLAAIDQALWATASGNSGGSLSNLLYSSIYGRSLFAFNVAPAILLLLPFYLVGLGGPGFLLFCQALGLGLGAFALFRLGKDRIGHLPAMLVALGYLAFFMTVRLAQGRFIMLTWSIPLILLALDAYQRRRILLFYFFSSLSLACGIDAAWALAAFGLYLIIFQRDRMHGFITFVLGVSWLAMVAVAFAPLFGGTAIEALGWSELSLDGTTFSANLGKLLHPESLSYLWRLLMPTAFMPILGIPLLLPAAPRLLFNLLAENPSAISLNGRYEIVVLPFLFAGIIAGIDWLASRAKKQNWAPPQFAAAKLVLVTCICSLVLLEPGFTANLTHRTTIQEAAILEAGQRIIDEIPPHASVAVQSPFAAALAHRQLLTVLPRAEDAQYILFDVFHPNREPVPLAYQESLMRAFQNPLYGLRSFDYGYLLFERDLDPTTKKAALVSDVNPDIQYARRVELGDTIAYLGFDLPTTIVQAGENVYITHYWQSILPTPNPYLQFTAYPGSQRFEKIALGVYSPDQWNPGDVVLHRQIISFPDLPDGKDYEIVVGLWYDTSDPVLQNPEQLLGQDVIRIATLSVSGDVYEIHPWLAQVNEDTP